MIHVCRVLVFFLLGFALGPAIGQTYPDKPIRILVGFAPGGGGDTLARAFQPELSKALGQSVVVENRPGANSMIAAGLVAKSPPDGYTLGVSSPPDITNALIYGNIAAYKITDFVPVAPMATLPLLLVVTPSFPANNVKEFIELAKAKPGYINYGTAGVGAPNHLFMELFAHKMGLKLTAIPYKGGAQSAAAVLAGDVHAAWVSGPQAMPQIKAGRFKPLAISSRTRNAALPDVPTMLESGVPGFAVDTWFGIHAPAGTPPAIVKQLNAEITRIAKSKEMVERIEKSGSIPLYLTPEEFADLVNNEAKLWKDLFENVDLQSLRTN